MVCVAFSKLLNQFASEWIFGEIPPPGESNGNVGNSSSPSSSERERLVLDRVPFLVRER
jgi:hypothetical protein